MRGLSRARAGSESVATSFALAVMRLPAAPRPGRASGCARRAQTGGIEA